MPRIRGMISQDARMVGHFDDGAAVLEFVTAKGMRPLAALGTSCPDHFLRTKIRPLVVEFDPGEARPRRHPRRAAGGGRGLPRGLCRLLRAVPAARQPGAARPERGGLSRPGGGHDHLRQGQGDGADLGRVLRQRDQRDARGVGDLGVSRAAGAGGLRHRVLAARGGEAPADAEAEEPRRPHRHRHRRRRRHRRGDGRAAARRGGLRGAGRHRRRRRWPRRGPASRRAIRPTWCGRWR